MSCTTLFRPLFLNALCLYCSDVLPFYRGIILTSRVSSILFADLLSIIFISSKRVCEKSALKILYLEISPDVTSTPEVNPICV